MIYNKNHKVLRFIFFLGLLIPMFSCAENEQVIRERQQKQALEQREKLKKENSERNGKIVNPAIESLINQYSNPFDLNVSGNEELLARAFNNPEENPNIRNSTSPSKTEFEYQKDKVIFEKIRSTKYLIVGLNVFGNRLEKYDFDKKCFVYPFDSYTIMAPESNVLYTQKRPPVVKLLVKNKQDIKINIDPEKAEQFKNGITNTAQGVEAMYGMQTQMKDCATIYIVLKLNGKEGDDVQHVSVEVVDYICFWYIDGGASLSGYYGQQRSCDDPLECATEVKVFRK